MFPSDLQHSTIVSAIWFFVGKKLKMVEHPSLIQACGCWFTLAKLDQVGIMKRNTYQGGSRFERPY
jgi:hypothetical protein